MRTEFYVQFEADYYGRDRQRVRRVRAKRLTTGRPSTPIPGSVVVKMTVEIPDEAFLPYQPEAEIIVPIDRTQRVIVVVPEPEEAAEE